MIRRLIPAVAFGRWTPTQSARFGEAVGSVGFFAVGPVAVLFNLPKRWQKPDPLPSIFDLNKHLREVAALRKQLAGEPVPD